MTWQKNDDGTYSRIDEVERVTIEELQKKIAAFNEMISDLTKQRQSLEADLATLQNLG